MFVTMLECFEGVEFVVLIICGIPGHSPWPLTALPRSATSSGALAEPKKLHH